MKPVRLLPIVIVAGTALTGLKMLGLLFDGGYLLASVQHAEAAEDTAAAAADESAPASAAETSAPTVPPIDGAGETSADADGSAVEPASAGKRPAQGEPVMIGMGSEAERAVLERLGERRRTLEERAKEIELREQLLKAAEQRLEQRVAKLKALEKQIGGAVGNNEKRDKAKFGDLVKMYESMKPKAAAQIFDRLDLAVLVPVAKLMSPRKLGDVMARMSPEAAEKLTVALATNRYPGAEVAGSQLPKIEGQKPAQP